MSDIFVGVVMVLVVLVLGILAEVLLSIPLSFFTEFCLFFQFNFLVFKTFLTKCRAVTNLSWWVIKYSAIISTSFIIVRSCNWAHFEELVWLLPILSPYIQVGVVVRYIPCSGVFLLLRMDCKVGFLVSVHLCHIPDMVFSLISYLILLMGCQVLIFS